MSAREANPWELCGVYSERALVPTAKRTKRGVAIRRKARCNRARGHDGAHTETRLRDFKRLATWGGR